MTAALAEQQQSSKRKQAELPASLLVQPVAAHLPTAELAEQQLVLKLKQAELPAGLLVPSVVARWRNLTGLAPD